MLFYDNIRDNKSLEYSFYFFRVVVIRVLCMDLIRVIENNEY